MARVPAEVHRFNQIHEEVMEDEKWALGILERGERKTGVRMYLQRKSSSKRETPRIVKEAIRHKQKYIYARL